MAWCEFPSSMGSGLRLCALLCCTGAASLPPPPGGDSLGATRTPQPSHIRDGPGTFAHKPGVSRPRTVQVTTSPRSAHGDDAGLHRRSNAAAYARWAFCLSRRKSTICPACQCCPVRRPIAPARPADRPCSTKLFGSTPTRKTTRRPPPAHWTPRTTGVLWGQA